MYYLSLLSIVWILWASFKQENIFWETNSVYEYGMKKQILALRPHKDLKKKYYWYLHVYVTEMCELYILDFTQINYGLTQSIMIVATQSGTGTYRIILKLNI